MTVPSACTRQLARRGIKPKSYNRKSTSAVRRKQTQKTSVVENLASEIGLQRHRGYVGKTAEHVTEF